MFGLVPLLWTYLPLIRQAKMPLCGFDSLEADTDTEFGVQRIYSRSTFMIEDGGRRWVEGDIKL